MDQITKGDYVYNITIDEYNKNRDKNLLNMKQFKVDLEKIFDLIPNKYHNIRFNISFGDYNKHKPEKIVFSKGKIIGDDHVILLGMDLKRLFIHANECLKNTTLLTEKKNKIMWRGATTGQGIRENNPRIQCIENWYEKNQTIDIGLTSLIQHYENDKTLEKYIKQSMSYIEQIKYKYILCIEGNDVPSSAAWNLASGSLIIAPLFKNESILGHSKLIPYKHFVPVKSDFSDLMEIYEWCESHQKECQEIVNNARDFIKTTMERDFIKESADIMISYFENYNIKNNDENKN